MNFKVFCDSIFVKSFYSAEANSQKKAENQETLLSNFEEFAHATDAS